jgi:hypothetical protein
LFGQYGLGNSREEKMAEPSRWTAEKRYQIVKEALSQKEPMLQGDFTDYVTEDGEKSRIGGVTEYLSLYNLVSEVLDRQHPSG